MARSKKLRSRYTCSTAVRPKRDAFGDSVWRVLWGGSSDAVLLLALPFVWLLLLLTIQIEDRNYANGGMDHDLVDGTVDCADDDM